MGIELRPRDYRGNYLYEVLPAHPLGERSTTLHACPECPLGNPGPHCPVCLAEGVISTDRLDRYAAAAEHAQLLGA